VRLPRGGWRLHAFLREPGEKARALPFGLMEIRVKQFERK